MPLERLDHAQYPTVNATSGIAVVHIVVVVESDRYHVGRLGSIQAHPWQYRHCRRVRPPPPSRGCPTVVSPVPHPPYPPATKIVIRRPAIVDAYQPDHGIDVDRIRYLGRDDGGDFQCRRRRQYVISPIAVGSIMTLERCELGHDDVTTTTTFLRIIPPHDIFVIGMERPTVGRCAGTLHGVSRK